MQKNAGKRLLPGINKGIYVCPADLFSGGRSVAFSDTEHHPEQAAQESGTPPHDDFHGVTSRTAYSLPEANDSDGDDHERRYHDKSARRHETREQYAHAEAYRGKRQHTVLSVHV